MTTQPLSVRRRSGRSGLALLLVLVLLVLASVAHLGQGARTIGPQTVVRAFLAFDPRNFDHQDNYQPASAAPCGGAGGGAAPSPGRCYRR